MTIPEQPLDPPDYGNDERPRFFKLSEGEQEDIIETFHNDHPEEYTEYYAEAKSQLPENHDHFDLWHYIARCIEHNFGEQEGWAA